MNDHSFKARQAEAAKKAFARQLILLTAFEGLILFLVLTLYVRKGEEMYLWLFIGVAVVSSALVGYIIVTRQRALKRFTTKG